MTAALPWTALRHRVLRDIAAHRHNVVLTDGRWKFRRIRSSRAQLARVANSLWHSGLIDVCNEGWTALTGVGEVTLPDWDLRHHHESEVAP